MRTFRADGELYQKPEVMCEIFSFHLCWLKFAVNAGLTTGGDGWWKFDENGMVNPLEESASSSTTWDIIVLRVRDDLMLQRTIQVELRK